MEAVALLMKGVSHRDEHFGRRMQSKNSVVDPILGKNYI